MNLNTLDNEAREQALDAARVTMKKAAEDLLYAADGAVNGCDENCDEVQEAANAFLKARHQWRRIRSRIGSGVEL